MSDEVRYLLIVFLMVLLIYRADAIFRQGKPSVFDWVIAKLTGRSHTLRKPSARKREPTPPSAEDIRRAEENRAQLILAARKQGFPDGLFKAARGQRFGPSRYLVDKIQPVEIFPDVREVDLKQAATKVNRLLSNSYGDALLGGKITSSKAIESLASEIPGFSKETYLAALSHSCFVYR